MWKNYSAAFIKKNRVSSISIMAAAFIASLCLSFLCGIFFNIWRDEIDRIIETEGDWQGRIGIPGSDGIDLATINQFPNVEKAAINEELSGEGVTAVDIIFSDARTIFQDMPLITNKLGLTEDTADYHVTLLSRYLIHDPQDENPPLLLTFYLAILLVLCVSLILIIHNSFALSMNSRIRQFGIFSSVGATPGQIFTCLMQEAFVLCAIPILLGSLLGILSCFGMLQGINAMADKLPGWQTVTFQYHPVVFAATILSAGLTVFFSAGLPARKLSRLTPLEAIRQTEGGPLKRKRRPWVLTLLFGTEGKLAGNALRSQRKALRTSTLSLTLSFLAFTVMLCFFTLSGISMNHTYFERYQDAWDVMVTVRDTRIEDFKITEELRALDGVQDLIVYQKAEADVLIPEKWQSEELIGLGGFGVAAGMTEAGESRNIYQLAAAPVVILDDESFLAYCKQIGAVPRLDGTIILNQIWDRTHSNFRYPSYIPFVKEDRKSIQLQADYDWEAFPGDLVVAAVDIPVLAYTGIVPVLREEYENFSLVQFVSCSLWEETMSQTIESTEDVSIRVLAGEDAAVDELTGLEEKIVRIVSRVYETESENRIGDKIANDSIIFMYMLLIGGFCVLLAIIGMANVFSNTLGFLSRRKQELARYMSVGMTPSGIRKLFCIEALVIAGKPLLITLPLTVLFVNLAAGASYLDPAEFWAVAPVAPVAVFGLAIVGFVFLAYYIGGRKVFRYSLVEMLKNETME